jgi:RNA polymerase sigma-70 factor (ECF subfamily)
MIETPDRDRSRNDDFETYRRFLGGLAYRMLGSVAEAEDVVQDAYLRWCEVDRETVAEPRAYLARVVSRLCLDRMKSARYAREQYVGTWLPEPVVAQPANGLADDLSLALLLSLERLSPLERAAFLLHDVFDMDYAAVGEVIERNETACRQLAARAREHIRDQRPRYARDINAAQRLAEAFTTAAISGDVEALARVLADDAVYYSDGGGKRRAALNPIIGKARILRFYEGIRTKGAFAFAHAEPTMLNGLPGFVFHTHEGTESIAFDVAHGRIVAIYAVRNPDKLRHLS